MERGDSAGFRPRQQGTRPKHEGVEERLEELRRAAAHGVSVLPQPVQVPAARARDEGQVEDRAHAFQHFYLNSDESMVVGEMGSVGIYADPPQSPTWSEYQQEIEEMVSNRP